MGLEALREFAEKQQQEEKREPVSKKLSSHIEKKEKEQELHKKLADNIRKSEMLRSKINKDIQQGKDVNSLLKDCLKCINLMTGDEMFYNQNIKILQQEKK